MIYLEKPVELNIPYIALGASSMIPNAHLAVLHAR